jgi:hypothetical protein
MIASHLLGLSATADDVAHFNDDDRRMAEKSAGTRKGSDDTWRMVIEMLAASHRGRALCPFCGHGDPEGVAAPPQPFGHPGPCSR